MSENKNAKTPADGPEYERGFIDGMQRQMQLHVNRVIKEEPTKIFGPNLEAILNRAGFQRPREWVGLTDRDIDECYFAARQPDFDVWAFAEEIEAVLKEKNS